MRQSLMKGTRLPGSSVYAFLKRWFFCFCSCEEATKSVFIKKKKNSMREIRDYRIDLFKRSHTWWGGYWWPEFVTRRNQLKFVDCLAVPKSVGYGLWAKAEGFFIFQKKIMAKRSIQFKVSETRIKRGLKIDFTFLFCRDQSVRPRGKHISFLSFNIMATK